MRGFGGERMTFVDLLNAYHIMPQFPPAAAKAAERMPGKVPETDLDGRRDLTDMQIFTIDGDDAKDFDDAVSVESLDSGGFRLGVHIADVSRYVKENSPIDHAAFMRGTSIYLIDTVIPMLPFELSNNLCSLVPHEIRLTVSVFMDITPRGRVEKYEICESFIKSCERMTYADVTKILEGDGALCEKYSHILQPLRDMQRLAEILHKRRVANGSIEFVTHESQIILDEKGKPTAVRRYPITLSNNIIEEFMLICNKTVAKHLNGLGLPCVFRVHEKPDMQKVERLGEVLPLLGVDFNFNCNMSPKDFRNILRETKDTELSEIVSYLVLRTMSRARYCEKNLGHFGLAFSDYCHFTSPIRRYPDLAVHRILKESLHGEVGERRKEELRGLAVVTAVSASMSEMNAADAELTWKSVKKCEFMENYIGEIYRGVITHVTTTGFFVELENTIEGFVPASLIEDDVYIMAEDGLSLAGMKNRKKYSIGDSIEIKVCAVDSEKRRIDFEPTGQKTQAAYLRRKGSKNRLGKKEKNVLRELKAERHETLKQKNELRKKAKFEKDVFENAVTYVLTEKLCRKCGAKKREARFVQITVSDVAARASLPLYRRYVHDIYEYDLNDCMMSAAKMTDTAISAIEEGFGALHDRMLHDFAAEFVRAAVRHFDVCMKKDDMTLAKREREYENIARKTEKRVKGAALR